MIPLYFSFEKAMAYLYLFIFLIFKNKELRSLK